MSIRPTFTLRDAPGGRYSQWLGLRCCWRILVVGAFFLSYGLGAEMLNFGALIAFMGVNAAALVRYYIRAEEKNLGNLIPPVLGFLICLGLWLNLSRPAKIVGSIWMIAGIAFGVWKTRGFREQLSFEAPPE